MVWHKIATEITSVFVRNDALTQTSFQDLQLLEAERNLGPQNFYKDHVTRLSLSLDSNFHKTCTN